MFGAILKCSKKAKVLEIITDIYAHQSIKCWYKSCSWLLKESRKCVFSIKKKERKKKLWKILKSFAWSRFSKIGLQLVKEMDFVRNDTAIKKLARVN